MRSHGLWMVGVVILGLAAGGCGKEDSSVKPEANPGGAAATPAGTPKSTEASNAAAVVHQFLEAMRSGNDKQTLALLTTVARQKAIDLDKRPGPAADDSVEFKVGEVTMDGDDIAQVHCVWTDLDNAGNPRHQKTIWCCRREAEGWRVGGVAVFASGGDAPTLLNFEKPEEMAKEQERLKTKTSEREKRQSTTTSQEAGRNPEDSFRR